MHGQAVFFHTDFCGGNIHSQQAMPLEIIHFGAQQVFIMMKMLSHGKGNHNKLL